jgi:hypothetical protein
VRQAQLERAHGADQVDLDHLRERVHVRAEQRSSRRDPRVGHRDVDAAEALDRLGDGALERLGIGHVGLEPDRVRAALARDPLEPLGLEPHERQARAPARQLPRRLRADAARGTGYQDRPARQLVRGHRAGRLAAYAGVDLVEQGVLVVELEVLL